MNMKTETTLQESSENMAYQVTGGKDNYLQKSDMESLTDSEKSASYMDDMQRKQDDKAARMLEIYANQRFNSVRSAQRMRLRLLVWAIRNKIDRGTRA